MHRLQLRATRAIMRSGSPERPARRFCYECHSDYKCHSDYQC